jgi:hypothetical protein
MDTVLMTAQDCWLYQDERYGEARERVLREGGILFDLLGEMGWNPRTPEEHESVASQTAKDKVARTALRELRERLRAAHQAGK